MPSDTAQVSSFSRRSTIASRAMRFSFVASAKMSCASRIATRGLKTRNLKPETRNLHPVREAHAAARCCRRAIGCYVVQVFEFHRLHGARQSDPVKNFRGTAPQALPRQPPENLGLLAAQPVDGHPVDLLIDDNMTQAPRRHDCHALVIVP